MKNAPHFIEFINDVKQEWELFPKDGKEPVADFKPTLDLLFKQHSLEWVDENKFVDRALYAYQERLVDDFTDSGLSVDAFIISETFVLGSSNFNHYADLFKLCVQSAIV